MTRQPPPFISGQYFDFETMEFVYQEQAPMVKAD